MRQSTRVANDCRRRNVCLWRAQAAIAVSSFAVNLAGHRRIPKVGTPPIAHPVLIQSVELIVLMMLTMVALVLMLRGRERPSGSTSLNSRDGQLSEQRFEADDRDRI